ncbi:helix-turn-helix transcriptional regulator [Colwellia sp. C1TZA3]|uniref:helix-turn-helix transcriptional regulator n=1 Tax=Colwellia sp. C1TZA3 TaxID=2508879 RepID=UPI0011B9C290|nr:response regulator transcription factor [Colwellia sp. C1TZA3]TWX72607.1 helix-turn-helix domain-containing protein [Colwellia sp. C1TZA3]
MTPAKQFNAEITLPEQYTHGVKQPIDASWIRLLYVALQQQNLPANELLASVGIESATLHELAYVQREVVLKLYENIAIHNGLDTLPSSIAKVFQPHFLRHTGAIMSDAKSVNDLLEKFIFASDQMNKLIKVVMIIKADYTWLVISSRVESLNIHKVSLEIGLCLVYRLIKQIFPADSAIIGNIILSVKSKRNDFENIFDCPVGYHNKDEYIIVINNKALTTRNIFSTHSIGFEPFIDSKFSTTVFKRFSDIERLIVENMASSNLNITFIADKMNVSVKTLQRQLKRFNTDFSTLLTKQKIKHAQMLLSENKFTLTQISYKLGFKSPSSFSRSFKQWTGVSPSNYQ